MVSSCYAECRQLISGTGDVTVSCFTRFTDPSCKQVLTLVPVGLSIWEADAAAGLSISWPERVFPVAEIVLADSSEVALRLAADFVPTQVQRQQVDLADLPWSDRWDIAFLLDVLEHLPDHERLSTSNS